MWNLLVILFIYWAFLLDSLPLQLEIGASLLWVQLPGQLKLPCVSEWGAMEVKANLVNKFKTNPCYSYLFMQCFSCLDKDNQAKF